MSACIDEVSAWILVSNWLQLNQAKTEVIWCSSSRQQHQIPSNSIHIGSTNRQPVTSIRDLGSISTLLGYDYEDTCHSSCQSMFSGFTSNPERVAISVTSCLADLGPCSDCQQGGLLQLSPRWYIVPAARPVAVHIECCRPSGFLSEAVRTHNPIAS